MDITIAGTAMWPVWARRTGRAVNMDLASFFRAADLSCMISSRELEKFLPMPMTTRKAVQNLPKSTTALPALSIKSSGFEHRPHIQFGNGARTYVATTRRGRYSCHKAQDKMTRRKPMARIYDHPSAGSCYSGTSGLYTKDKAMMVLRPAVMARSWQADQ